MRKLLKYSFGRHKYQKKNILVDMHDEPKILHILLFEIECDWSYGMDLQTNLINIKDEQVSQFLRQPSSPSSPGFR